jgi:hypothetical protein
MPGIFVFYILAKNIPTLDNFNIFPSCFPKIKFLSFVILGQITHRDI